MIDDTLKANPGMRETYRAYARLMSAWKSLKDMELQVESLRKQGGHFDEVLQAEERLSRVDNLLPQIHAEIRQCLENEKQLRIQQGLPPLETKVLNSAEEFLKNHTRISSVESVLH